MSVMNMSETIQADTTISKLERALVLHGKAARHGYTKVGEGIGRIIRGMTDLGPEGPSVITPPNHELLCTLQVLSKFRKLDESEVQELKVLRSEDRAWRHELERRKTMSASGEIG